MRQAMLDAAVKNPGPVADLILKAARPGNLKTNGWKVNRRGNGRRSK
jgi:hypothetical protein